MFGYEGMDPLDTPRGYAPGAKNAPVPPDSITVGRGGGEVFSGGSSRLLGIALRCGGLLLGFVRLSPRPGFEPNYFCFFLFFL